MQTPTLQSLSDNVFRTLGLSGSATAAEISSALQNLQADPNLTRVPTDDLASPLKDPHTRLLHRALWRLSDAPASSAVDSGEPASNRDAIACHDLAIAELHEALAADPNAEDFDRWAHVIERLNETAVRVDLIERLSAIDSASGCQPMSTLSDAANAVARLPTLVAGAMATEAIAHLKRNRFEQALRLGRLARLAVDGNVARDRILDAADHRLAEACRQIADGLSNRLQAPPEDAEQRASTYVGNRIVASDIEDLYRDRIFPLLHLIGELCDDAARVGRARQSCENALFVAARAWEWGGHYRRAEAVLLTAIACCSPIAQRDAFRDALDRLRPHADEERKLKSPAYVPDATSWAKSPFLPASPVTAPPSLPPPATLPNALPPPFAVPVRPSAQVPPVAQTAPPNAYGFALPPRAVPPIPRALPIEPVPVLPIAPPDASPTPADPATDTTWRPYWIKERFRLSEFLVPFGFALAIAIVVGSIWYVRSIRAERSHSVGRGTGVQGNTGLQSTPPPVPSYGNDKHPSSDVMSRLRQGLATAPTRPADGNAAKPTIVKPTTPLKPSADGMGLPRAPARIPMPPTSQPVLGPFEALGEFNREP
jgi:hypothetical protein